MLYKDCYQVLEIVHSLYELHAQFGLDVLANEKQILNNFVIHLNDLFQADR